MSLLGFQFLFNMVYACLDNFDLLIFNFGTLCVKHFTNKSNRRVMFSLDGHDLYQPLYSFSLRILNGKRQNN